MASSHRRFPFLLATLASPSSATSGWPSCPSACSGHGACSHIGVCSCDRGWRGDDCSEGVCPSRCAGHGMCITGDAGASCACDAGYVGADCARRAPPPPPPVYSVAQARQTGEVAPGPPVHLNFTLSSRLGGLSATSHALGPLLPADSVSAFMVTAGAAGKKPRLLHVRLGPQLKLVEARDLDDGAFLAAAPAPRSAGAPGNRALSAAAARAGLSGALQPGRQASAPPAPPPPPREVTASAVDWAQGFGYVALTAGETGAPALLQLGLPSMSVLARRALDGLDMVRVSCVALVRSQLFVAMSDAAGREAEVLMLRLPDMQPLHATRFAVPSPVAAMHADAHSDWVYLLCAATPRPRLFRLHGEFLEQFPGARPDSVELPWGGAGALPLLLPFPEQRQMLVLAAPEEGEGQGQGQGPHAASLRVCRLHLGDREPLPRVLPNASCAVLQGELAREAVISGVADDVSGAAYLGCRSGASLRLRLSPLRLEARVRPARVPLTSALLRPADGALWFGTADGSMLQLSTRSRAFLLGPTTATAAQQLGCNGDECAPPPMSPPYGSPPP